MQALEEARLMPARFRPLADLNAISSLHRRQHRATITVPPLKRGAEAKVPLLYRSRERVPAAPSQVDVQLANTIVRAGVAGGWNALLCHPRRLGRLARPGGRLRFGRLPVLCSGAHWQGTMSYELTHARRGLGQAVADDRAITASDGIIGARRSVYAENHINRRSRVWYPASVNRMLEAGATFANDRPHRRR